MMQLRVTRTSSIFGASPTIIVYHDQESQTHLGSRKHQIDKKAIRD
jgi:hypothetical protein